MMKIRYNVTGTRRRELAQIISDITEAKAEYQYMPSCAYKIGSFTLTKDGTLEADDKTDAELTKEVLAGIAEAGFETEDNAETETSEADEPVGLTVSIPLNKVNVGNLTRLLEAKGSLIEKALGIEALPVEVSEDTVSFPWFDELPDTDKVTACTHLIAALCKMSKDQKRITATAKDVENEKYAFRCFLLRLGFIGPEYKAERKILLQNLSGSAAFKGGAEHEDAE